MNHIKCDHIDIAYQMILSRILTAPVSKPRGLEIRELRNAFVELPAANDQLPTTASVERNKTMAKYADKEMLLYQQQSLSASQWADASKFWLKLANPDGTINSNYGYLIEGLEDAPIGSQWDWAKHCLTTDPDTRQAVMHFNRTEHQWEGNKDFPCTMHMQFFIRQGLLEADIVMRSQDVVKGFPYDMKFFIHQQIKMAKELRIEHGPISHHVHSLHMYTKDHDLVEEMLFDSFR